MDNTPQDPNQDTNDLFPPVRSKHELGRTKPKHHHKKLRLKTKRARRARKAQRNKR